MHPQDDSGAPQRARQPPWETEAQAGGGGATFGTWLRRQREARNIGLREIADRTKISLRYLAAMEDDRFDLLPAPLFAKGFLREYARYVGLNPDEVVNHWLSVQQPEEPDELETTLIGKVARRGRSGQNQKGRGWAFYFFFILAGLLLLGLVALFVYYNEKRQKDPAVRQLPPMAAPAPPASTPTQVLPPPSPPPDEPSAPIELTLDFTRNCWVEAVIDGKPHTAEERVQGESLELEAQQSIDLKLGDAGAVTLQVNGRPMTLQEGSGQVSRLRIDLDTVRTLQQSPQGPQAAGTR